MEIKINKDEVLPAIEAEIQKTIGEALSKDSGALISSVVRHALTQKKNSYDRTTIFGNAINDMIREAAKETMVEWINTQRPKIKSAVMKRLKSEGNGFVDSIADKIISGLSGSFYVSANLHVAE